VDAAEIRELPRRREKGEGRREKGEGRREKPPESAG